MEMKEETEKDGCLIHKEWCPAFNYSNQVLLAGLYMYVVPYQSACVKHHAIHAGDGNQQACGSAFIAASQFWVDVVTSWFMTYLNAEHVV